MKPQSLIICVFLLSTFVGLAQKDKPDNLPKFDQKWVHFGFALGVSSNGLVLEQNLAESDSLAILDVRSQPGFNINIVSELHMGKYFGLRFTPGIAFAARDLEYTYFNSAGGLKPVETKTVESTYIDIPLSLKYRSARLNNFACYVLAGFKYSIDLASQTDVDNALNADGEVIVKLRPSNYMGEVGIGFDFFLEYFKFTPELKFSFGLNDVSFQDGTQYSAPIEYATPRMFVLGFNFEG